MSTAAHELDSRQSAGTLPPQTPHRARGWIDGSRRVCETAVIARWYRGPCSAFADSGARSLTSPRTRAGSRPALVCSWRGHACSATRAVSDEAAPPAAGWSEAGFEGPGDTGREPRRGAADRGLHLSIDGFCPHIPGCLQPRSHPASPIHASQRIRRLCNANAHLLHPSTEAAQREPHQPDHHRAHDSRRTNIARHDIDLQDPAAGME